MNIFIKIYIISTLIGLNSSAYLANIKIDKSGLKSVPKNFEGKNGQFRLKIAKRSENGEWEIDPEYKSEITNANGYATLKLPKKWEDPFLEKKQWLKFMFGVKVEMVDNKSVIKFENFNFRIFFYRIGCPLLEI